MARVGYKIVGMLLLALALAGCRTPQPELKPSPQPEVLTVPPKEARYQRPGYPEVAFKDMNSQYRKPLDGGGTSGILNAGGRNNGPGGPSGGMMPAGGGMGSFR